jgi:heme-degrading monooxygenase HmoA
MIIRFFRALVHDGQQDSFRKFFIETALPLIRSQEGLVSVSVGLPHETSPHEFSMVTVWRDLDVLRRFAGDDWKSAVIHTDEAHLLKETFVHHYHALDAQH